MSEKSDLRERAREWVNKADADAKRGLMIMNSEQEAYEVIRDLLAALDDAEREERERCVEVIQKEISEYNDEGFNAGCRESIYAIQRKE